MKVTQNKFLSGFKLGSLSKVVALLLAISFAASNISAEPTRTDHRIAAGKPNFAGWYLAKSTKGNYSVQLPLAFDDFTVIEDKKSDIDRNEMIMANGSDGVFYAVTRIYYRDDGQAAYYFKNFIEGKVAEGAEVKRIKVREYDAVDIAIGNAKTASKQRALLVGENLFLLMVEWPIAQQAKVDKDAKTFLRSLNIKN
jgi:hypothetical protein